MSHLLPRYKTATVGEARQLSGPGTHIIWRPEGSVFYSRDPDTDCALIAHTSTPEDRQFAEAARMRELRTKTR